MKRTHGRKQVGGRSNLEGPLPEDTVSLLSAALLRRTPPLVIVAFLFPALAGFLFGFDIGTTSGAVHDLSLSPGGEGLSSPLLNGLLTSSSLGGAVLGTILCSYLGIIIGWRGELILGGILYATGTLVCILSPSDADVISWVISGRAIYGLGIAFSSKRNTSAFAIWSHAIVPSTHFSNYILPDTSRISCMPSSCPHTAAHL